ncbi:hypothetical protein [Streptomyces rimosus]|uniref:hypothetical protein n=1 Tax=Streptomyces rimosus TaxID=1927 RepID=UPI0004CAAF84|nr:hypothetical protein [Streptomyces rimosus]
MSDSDREPTTAASGQPQHLAATVAAHPMLNSVGALARLLAQLPPEMSLWLDEHAREDPNERLRQQFLTITPRIVKVASSVGIEDEPMQPGLELGTVSIPFDSDPGARAAMAARRDLSPETTSARAEERMEQGDVPGALGDAALVLQEVAALLLGATEWLDRSSPGAESLSIEAWRIRQTAKRVARIAKVIKEEDGG